MASGGIASRPRGSVLSAVGSISGVTLVSRLLGLVRDALMFHAFGAGGIFSAFVLAWMIPNLLRRLFGEGALSAAFVPAYAERQQRAPAAARALLAGVSGVLILGLGTLLLLSAAGLWLLPPDALGLTAADGLTGAERGQLLRDLLLVLLPYALPVCLLAIWSGAGNVHGAFVPGALAPVVLNLFWIAGLLVLHPDHAATPQELADDMRRLAGFLTVGGLVQVALAAWPLRRRDALPRPRLPEPGDGTRAVFRAMLPTAVGLSIAQVNLLVDQAIAEYLLDSEAPHVYLANRLVLFPHALVALPLATAVFPRLAVNASRANLGELRRDLDRAIVATLLLALPASVGLALIAEDFIAVFFEHGRTTAEQARLSARTTAALVAGLPAIGVAQLCARALYALGRTRAPARLGVVVVVLNVTLNLLFVLVFDFGVAGLTAATSVCSWVNAIALHRLVAVVAPGAGPPWPGFLRAGVATAAMAGTVLLTGSGDPDSGRWVRAVRDVGVPVLAGALVYVAVHVALRTPELRELTRRVLRRRR